MLTYHVVPGRSTATVAMQARSVETVQGPSITIESERVMIDDVTGVKADMPASNGVIHVIDTTLMPHRRTPAAASALLSCPGRAS